MGPEDRRREANAALAQGSAICDSDPANALMAFERALAYAQDDLPDVAASARYGRAWTLRRLGREDDAVELALRLADEGGEVAGDALLFLGNGHSEAERWAEALDAYSRLVEVCRSGTVESLAGALGSKAMTLLRLSRPEEALEVYGELLRLVGEQTEDAALRPILAQARYGRGMALELAGRREAAVDEYEMLLRRFGRGEGPVVDERLALARAALERLGEKPPPDERRHPPPQD